MLTKEEKEARIKKETRKIVRRYNEQGFVVPDGCSVRYYRDFVRRVIMKHAKTTLQRRKWGELYSLDYYSILGKVNDEIDEYFDWK